MDLPTQGLLGALTAQLGFRRRIGPGATWAAAAAAMLADGDSYVLRLAGLHRGPGEFMSKFFHHRGISHSLLAVPVIAAVVAGLWWLLRRLTGRLRRRTRETAPSNPRAAPFGMLYACCFVGALTHPLLDWCTSYGTQLLAPITSEHYALNAVGIIDAIYTAMLVVALAGCYLVRKFGKRPAGSSLKIALAGMLLSTCYLAAGYGMGRLARHYVRRSSPQAAGELRAYPRLGTIFVWRVTRKTATQWTAVRVNVLFGYRPDEWARQQVPVEDNQWIRRARELPAARRYEWFAMGRVRPAYRRDGGRHVVELHDMRHGLSGESVRSLWPVVITFDDEGRLLSVARPRHFRHTSRASLIRQIWRQLRRP